jgi:hypothetical protein
MSATAHLRGERGTSWKSLPLFIVSLAAVVAAAISVFNRGNGIAYSGGAYLVLASTILFLIATFIILLWPTGSRWLRGILLFLILLDLFGTSVAAYFLEARALLIAMALGFVAWLFCVSSRNRRAAARRRA